VIATLAARATTERPVEIVTGDRDMLQVVRDDVATVLFTRRGVSELDRFDNAAVRAKYGVPAVRYADFAILRGDPSDGLPGVKGVGEKRAAGLVNAHPSLDALLEDADKRTTRLSGPLLAAREYIAAMRLIVPVRTDVPLTDPVGGDMDEDRVLTLTSGWNVGGSGRRLVQACRDVAVSGSTA